MVKLCRIVNNLTDLELTGMSDFQKRIILNSHTCVEELFFENGYISKMNPAIALKNLMLASISYKLAMCQYFFTSCRPLASIKESIHWRIQFEKKLYVGAPPCLGPLLRISWICL